MTGGGPLQFAVVRGMLFFTQLNHIPFKQIHFLSLSYPAVFCLENAIQLAQMHIMSEACLETFWFKSKPKT